MSSEADLQSAVGAHDGPPAEAVPMPQLGGLQGMQGPAKRRRKAETATVGASWIVSCRCKFVFVSFS